MTSSHDPESSARPDPWSRRSGDGGELAEPAEPAVSEALEAGFTHRYGGHGTGFAAGGPLDVMLPGPDLAWHAGAARQRGLGALSDDELIGVLGGARRPPGRRSWNWPRWPSWTPGGPGRTAATGSTWLRRSPPC